MEVEIEKQVAEIVKTYLATNQIAPEHIASTIEAVSNAARKALSGEAPAPELKPAVPIKKSIFDDYIVCLEDGKKFKSLKRHLRTHYNLSPNEYREKWGLPFDYPMVAPAYALQRSALAKTMGLGTKRAETPKPKPVKVGKSGKK